MGVLRLMLALAVVFEHAPGEFRIKFVPGDIAVEMFFMISGFYMALILSTRYDTTTARGAGVFYLARYLRLWPAYAVTAAVLCAWLAFVFVFTGHPAMGPANTWPQSLLWRCLIGFSNLTMIGQDILALFHVTSRGAVELTFGPPNSRGDGSLARIVGQAWSIGIEIWFYLLAPFLIRFRSVGLIAVASASFVLRYILGERFGLGMYFFFPAQLGLFVAGMLAYRWRNTLAAENRSFALCGLFALIVVIVAFGYVVPEVETCKWGLYCLLFVFMPAIFQTFRANSVDRLIGELSYPIYITHNGIISIFGVVYLKLMGAMPPGPLLLLLIVSLAAVLFFAVDAPVDRFRHRLVGSGAKSDDRQGGANAALLPLPTTLGLKDS